VSRQENLKLARAELDDLGLHRWALKVDSAKRRLGQTRYRKGEIGLSAFLLDLNGWERVRTTVRHEAAHALVGPGFGHGPVWKMKAIELGVKPESCASEPVAQAPKPWGAVCDNCGPLDGVGWYRKPSRTFVHRTDNGLIRFVRRYD
jgi:hypothetical protein